MNIAIRNLKARTRPAPKGCWRWRGAKNSSGYGVLRRGQTLMLAHRAMWCALTGQPVPAGRLVLHWCDVRDCINPEHLWLGTALMNNQDMTRKGRGRPGGRVPKGRAA